MKLQGYQAALSAPSAPVLDNAPPLPVGSTGQVLLWADGAPAWSELSSVSNPFDQSLNTTDDPTFLSGSFASLFDGTGGSVSYAQSAYNAGNATSATSATNAYWASWANGADHADSAGTAYYAGSAGTADCAYYAAGASTANIAIHADPAINFPNFFNFTQGASIADQVGTVSVADFNAVLAILRAMQAIATLP